MRWVAGIDVGNATTEIVLADISARRPVPLAWDRTPTRGVKGSEASVAGAVDLLHRIERTTGVRADLLVMAPQRPVRTVSAVVSDPAPDTGRLVRLSAGRATPSGRGYGVGQPIAVERSPDPSIGPVVLVASDPLGFRATSRQVQAWVHSGAEVVGVLLAGDEAVLVSRRLQVVVPVVDQADTALALASSAVALEVGEDGRPVRLLADPVRLAASLGLGPEEHAHAEALARTVRGLRDVAIAVLARPVERVPAQTAQAWVEDSDGRHDLLEVLRAGDLRTWESVRSLALPAADGALVSTAVEDLWAVDLTALIQDAVLRPDTAQAHAIALATMSADDSGDVHAQAGWATSWSGRPVRTVDRESDAARAGALSTPGADPGAWVVDVGGGTIDVVRPDGSARVLAGAGDLLTAATAALLEVPNGQAEWVKRGPSARVEAPHVLVAEDGTRRFLDVAAAAGSVGWLVVPGPAGALPFHRNLTPSEWRSLRLRLKRAVLGDNMARGAAGDVEGDVIVVGGPAGDDEVLDCVARALPGAVPGRGDVAGLLGHRWAVAWGLVTIAASGNEGRARGAPSAEPQT